MKKLLQTGLMAALLALTACGYHLVGHGGGVGAIPDDVRTVTILGSGDAGHITASLTEQLSSERYEFVDSGAVADKQHHAIIQVNISPVSYVPSAYDSVGMATQYRLTLNGSITVEKDDKFIWQSGPIRRQGDVFVAGGPASIEASRERLFKDLRKMWIMDATSRIRSGF